MIVTDLFNFWAAKWDLTAQNTNSSFLGTNDLDKDINKVFSFVLYLPNC
jgi:hypothetical protein